MFFDLASALAFLVLAFHPLVDILLGSYLGGSLVAYRPYLVGIVDRPSCLEHHRSPSVVEDTAACLELLHSPFVEDDHHNPSVIEDIPSVHPLGLHTAAVPSLDFRPLACHP